MKKLIPIFLIFLILISFQIFINHQEDKKYLSKNAKNCNELDYENHKLNKVDNFGEFEIDLIIDEERKWKKIILNTQISERKDKSFTYDAKFTNATLKIKNKYGFECILKAKIKPHGDLEDHYREVGPGYDPILLIPSLKVKLLEGNIFGIVEFRLLVPATRKKSNEIFATTFFQEMGFYAPRTTFTKVNYNKKEYKFIFQEKLVKEFLEHNSLQEGLFFAGDERFSFKYENVLYNNGKIIEEKEIGISKFRITESKFLKKNQIFVKPAIETLQALNVSSHFYTSKIKQSWHIDYFTTQKNTEYEKFFVNLPEFDAMMYSIGAEHGLSRDDRRFYYDVLNKNLIPIYNDGAVRMFVNDKYPGPSVYTDIEQQLQRNKKFSSSAKIGALNLTKKIDDISLKDFKNKLKERGLDLPISELELVFKLIKKNLIFLSNLNNNEIIKVSNLNQHPIKNKEAIKKEIKASYLLTNNNQYKKCDLLLINCENIELTNKQLRRALKQDLEDSNGNELIFLGDLDKYKKLKTKSEIEADIDNENLFFIKDLNFKIYGNIDTNIDEKNKIIKFLKNDSNSRVLFFNSSLKNWSLEFIDNVNENKDIIRRDTNGLSGCLNIYDSKIENLKILTQNAKCEDALNIVRSNGTINSLKIKNSLFDGLDADFSNLIISKAEIINSGNDCMDFSYGVYNLSDLSLLGCRDKAVSTGEGSKLEIKNFVIEESLIGIASKDSAIVNSSDGLIKKVDKCLSIYKKKQEFNGGLLKYKNLECNDFSDFAFKDNYSKLIKLN